MPESALSVARKQVRTRYGKVFESKASDALVLSIAQPLAFSPASAVGRTFALAGGPGTTIVELGRPAAPRQVVPEGGHAALRRERAARLCETFYEQAAPLRERMGQAQGPREVAAPGTPSSLTQLCWLNSTLRTVANLPALADLAHDSKVERIGCHVCSSRTPAPSARKICCVARPTGGARTLPARASW